MFAQRATVVVSGLVLAALLTAVGARGAPGWEWPADGPVLRPFVLGDNPYAGGQPFAGNQIPASLISPEARRAQELLYPLPNFGPESLAAGNYRATFNGPESHRLLEGRLADRHVSGAHRPPGLALRRVEELDELPCRRLLLR